MMLKNIRNRLFASYIVVLIITLVLVASVTITTLSQREAPPEFTWNRLELLLIGFTSQQNMRDLIVADGRRDELQAMLEGFSTINDVRVMLVVNANDDAVVWYDSHIENTPTRAPQFEPVSRPGQAPASITNSRWQGGQANPQGNDGLQLALDSGRFWEGDVEWLYAGLTRSMGFRRVRADVTVLLAEPRSTESIQGVIAGFNDLIFRPLIRAALIAGLVALGFAIFLSRSITRPLQALAKSAQHVARGEYSEQVPETGPAEIQQVASAFNRMTAEVRATQQSQREFMANVSHDLKTPLTSIQGYSQAIMDGAARNPAEAASVIHEEAGRLDRMVQELTDLARLQAGRLSMKLTPIDIADVVTAIGQRLAVVADKKRIDLQIQNAPLPVINADGDRLVQVLMNLIGNAIKYTPEGGNVSVATGVRDGGVEIRVSDNGIGIPAADLPHIFDRFYQVDKSRGPQRGTGLGLAITSEIIASHGGTINIESPGVNQGTTVTVWLPSPNISTIASRRVNAE